MRRTAIALAALILPLPAAAQSLSPGDTITYAISSPQGERSVVVTYISRDLQRDNNGAEVRRDTDGRRLFDKGWTYAPHDGEFPDGGVMAEGDEWSFDVTLWQDPATPFGFTRSCAVTDQGNFGTADRIFQRAVKVECSFESAGEVFRETVTWYWRDGAGYYLLIDSVQRDARRGTVDVNLDGIASDAFR